MSEFDDRLVGLSSADPDDDDVRESELDADELDLLADEQISLVQLAFGQQSWRFGHVIVDEAQDLNPMQWRMIMRRARMRSMTIVGDIAQRTVGQTQDWQRILPDELSDIDQRNLTINYRSPSAINELATKILSQLVPGLDPSVSIRHDDGAVVVEPFATQSDLRAIVTSQQQNVGARRVAVIGSSREKLEIGGVTELSAHESKGLEFDVVVLVEPAEILRTDHGLSLLYVAATRATSCLVIAHSEPLPAFIESALSSQ